MKASLTKIYTLWFFHKVEQKTNSVPSRTFKLFNNGLPIFVGELETSSSPINIGKPTDGLKKGPNAG